MLPPLRRCFPDATITMLLRQYTGALVRGNSSVDEILWYDDGEDLLPFYTMTRSLRQRRFDAAIVVYPTLRLALLMFCAGIRVRIGTGYRYYSFLFNRRVYEHRRDAKRHELEYNLRLLEELGCHPEGRPTFPVNIPGDAEHAVDILMKEETISGTIVILHPGSGGSARDWHVENFAMLAQRLSDDSALTVLVTGTAGESRLADTIVAATDGRARSLAGKLTVPQLGALCKRADVFVSNSTGPMHIAAALGTPVVGLFPRHPAMSKERWGPYTERSIVLVPDMPAACDTCVAHGSVRCTCMDAITVDAVAEAISALRSRYPHNKPVA